MKMRSMLIAMVVAFGLSALPALADTPAKDASTPASASKSKSDAKASDKKDAKAADKKDAKAADKKDAKPADASKSK
ncbi:MAG TPA: hypothetical protein VLW26_09180 [Steroidobacteraceae bacterium]|nr:hypothetical protein [Steroidobacteraceae bacterium]